MNTKYLMMVLFYLCGTCNAQTTNNPNIVWNIENPQGFTLNNVHVTSFSADITIETPGSYIRRIDEQVGIEWIPGGPMGGMFVPIWRTLLADGTPVGPGNSTISANLTIPNSLGLGVAATRVVVSRVATKTQSAGDLWGGIYHMQVDTSVWPRQIILNVMGWPHLGVMEPPQN